MSDLLEYLYRKKVFHLIGKPYIFPKKEIGNWRVFWVKASRDEENGSECAKNL